MRFELKSIRVPCGALAAFAALLIVCFLVSLSQAAELEDVSGCLRGVPGAALICDFGNVRPFLSPALSHRFELRNTSGHAISIASILPVCSCVSIDEGRIRRFPVLLPPSGSISFSAAIRVSEFSNGPFSKEIDIFETDKAAPVLKVDLSGNVVAAARLFPNAVDLKQVVFGRGGDRMFTATADRKIVKDLNRLRVCCTIPQVSVQRIGAEVLSNRQLKLTFRLSLSKTAPIGPLSGEISLTYPRGDGKEAALGEPVQVRGSVTGSMRAHPRYVEIRELGSAEIVTIEGIADRDISCVGISRSSAVLSANLSFSRARPHLLVARLVLVQKALVDSSDSLGRVTLTLRTGEGLSIPVHLLYAEK